jgi:uncharacterized protein
MKKYFNFLIIFTLTFFSCINNGTTDEQDKMLSSDYRIFKNTIAWDLAKAIHDEDTDAIRQTVAKNKRLINFADPKYGQTLLGLAVYNEKYKSVEVLVELGANPNAFNNYDGKTPLMEAASIDNNKSGPDSRFLILLLRHGGDPNLAQKYVDYNGGSFGQTPLSMACKLGALDYVKILIGAGANINYKSYNGGATVLQSAMLSEKPDLVIYLIQHGIDYKRPTAIYDAAHKTYITDDLRTWRFDLGSEKYKKKMQIVEFLKKHGMDYRRAKIPDFYYDSYDKDYLDKY